MAPYGSEEASPSIPAPPAVPLSEIGVERWQYDLWFQIIRAVLSGHPEQVDLTHHLALQIPAMSRYAVTTPALERWFKKYNEASGQAIQFHVWLSGVAARRDRPLRRPRSMPC